MIDDTTKPALAILQPDWKEICPTNVDALMTLRSGGVSSGPFGDKDGIGGFNVGLYTGDVGFCIKMNRNLAAQLVPSDPKWLKQVHGVKVVDAETGREQWINTSSSNVRKVYNKWWYERQLSMNETMRRCAVDVVSIATDEDYVKALMGLFRKRAVR